MKTVLVADDDTEIADLLENYFTDHQLNVLVARNGRDALAIASQHLPDLIIMDLMMPQLTGGEAAVKIRRTAATAHIPIIAVTGIDRPSEFADLIQVDRILTKPFDLNELYEQMAELIDLEGHPLPPEVSESEVSIEN